MTLNAQQFTVYRGLSFSNVDPDDDAAVLGRIQHKPVTPDFEDRAVSYGSHWTTDPDVARTFALRASTNLDHRGPGAVSMRPRTGVVLEAQVSGPVEHSSHYRGYGEREVDSPGRLPIESVTAHVHHLPFLAKAHRTDTFLRSLHVR